MPDVDKNGSALRPVIAVIPHMSFFSSRLHLLQQSIWQQTTPQITRQNQASHFQNLTLGPLHIQDPNSWVTLRIAHWSTVAPWETKGTDLSQSPFNFLPFHFLVQPIEVIRPDITYTGFLALYQAASSSSKYLRLKSIIQQRMPCNMALQLVNVQPLMNLLHVYSSGESDQPIV